MSLLDKIRGKPSGISDQCKAYGPKLGSSEGLPEGWMWRQVQYYRREDVWHLKVTAEGPHGSLPYLMDIGTWRPNVLSNQVVSGEGHTWEEAMENARGWIK